MFFGKRKDKDDATQPKRRSTLGLLFNPDIGASIRPLGEATNVFVRLIAMVFAMNGLFPKNHPSLIDESNAPRLTLPEIFRTAWAGLEFTKAGMPKVALFVAVVGTLVLAALSIITALMAGFVGSAHAQAASTASTTLATAFSPASADLAQNWLDYLFKAVPLSNYYAQNGQAIASGIGIQCALMASLGFYSEAMLVFAGFILFYHLVSMVAHTAHDGVVMGKRANQVWAPIRLVFAIALLVPVGSGASNCSATNGAGLNSGQYIVIKMASLGSGMASQVWATFLTALSTVQTSVIQPTPPYVVGVAKDITLMEACRFDWNYNICITDAPLQGLDPVATCASPNSYTPSTVNAGAMILAPQAIANPDNSITYRYTTGNLLAGGEGNICGEYTIPSPTPFATADNNFSAASIGATTAVDPNQVANTLSTQIIAVMAADLANFAQDGAQILQFEWDTNNQPALTSNAQFVSDVHTFQTDVNKAITTTISTFNGQGLTGAAATSMATLGWTAAGAWLNTIARDQGAVVDAAENGLPQTTPPDLKALEASGATGTLVAVNLGSFEQWLSHAYGSDTNGTPIASQLTAPVDPCALQNLASNGGAYVSGGGGEMALDGPTPILQVGKVAIEMEPIVTKWIDKLIKGNTSDMKKMDIVTKIVDIEAARNGVWDTLGTSCTVGAAGPMPQGSYFKLGQQLVTANPLAELSFWGYANLRTAYDLWDDVFKMSKEAMVYSVGADVKKFGLAGGKNASDQDKIQEYGLNSKLLDFAASLFSSIAMIFFTCGYTLAFIVPLLPFFRFFFNVLTWVASVLEAVVAIPLVALAHLNPEGEGLSGQSAKSAYFLIFNLFLRPVLTVFGLIAGLLLFYVAIMFLNQTFAIAVTGTLATYNLGIETFVRVIYTITYGATAYVCANTCFRLIGSFPEHAMRWIGASAHHEKMGDQGAGVRAAMQQTSGYVGRETFGVARLRPPGGG